jgi:uncharacterized repeat protein (TIGR03803 family)
MQKRISGWMKSAVRSWIWAAALWLASPEVARGQATVVGTTTNSFITWDFNDGQNIQTGNHGSYERTVVPCVGSTATLRTEGAGSASAQVEARPDGGFVFCETSAALQRADVVFNCLGGIILDTCEALATASGSFLLQINTPVQVKTVLNGAGQLTQTRSYVAKPPAILSFSTGAGVGFIYPDQIPSTTPLSYYHGSGFSLLEVTLTPIDLTEAVLRGLEVTQSVQDWNNSVPLVAGKSTFVRASVEAKKESDQGRRVNGLLRGFRGAELAESPLSPVSGLEPNLDGRAKLKAEMIQDRLLGQNYPEFMTFVLPASWANGTVTLKLELEDGSLDPQEPAGLAGNLANDGQVVVTFTTVPKPGILLLPMKFLTTNGVVEAPSASSIFRIMAAVKGQLPVAGFDLQYAEPLVLDARLPDVVRDDILPEVQLRRAQDNPPDNLLYMGWLKSDLFDIVPGFQGGVGNMVGGNYGWSSVYPLSGFPVAANIAAHEFAHLLGRPHATDASLGTFGSGSSLYRIGYCGETNYTIGESFPWFYTINAVNRPTLGPMTAVNSVVYGFQKSVPNGRLTQSFDSYDPYRHFELMSYCWAEVAWPSKYTYSNILQHVSARYSASPSLPAFAAGWSPNGPQPVPIPGVSLLVRGVLDGFSSSVSWLPFQCLLGPAPAAPPPGSFEIRALNGSGGLVTNIFFDVPVPPDGSPGSMPFILPLQADTDIRQVSLLFNGTLIGSRVASPNAPSVQVLSPNGGEAFSNAPINIQWQASDADGDPLTCSVQYTRDNGATWRTLAVDLAATNLVVSGSELRGGTDCFFRVLASDGFNCAVDQSDAACLIADKGPLLEVTDPADGARFYASSPITLEAIALDMEEGMLTGTNLVWRSDRDGLLGTGETVFKKAAQLSEGDHVITVSANDSAGHTNSAAVHIKIGRLLPPVLEARGNVTNGFMLVEVFAQPDTLVAVERSTNLVDWLPFTNFPLASFSSVVSVPGTDPQSYFRANVTPLPPGLPLFAFQPQSVTTSNAGTFALSAAAASSQPASYQWYFEGSALNNQTNVTLLFPQAHPFQSGQYYLVASNGVGMVTSAVCSVSITNGTDYEVIHRFGTNALDGVNGWGPLALDADGWLYGCARNGGISNAGVIFKMRTNGFNFAVLRQLNPTNEGSAPLGGLILASDGALYGTCSAGGTNNSGTVFKLNRNGSGFSVVHHFLSSGDCRNPQAELLEGSDGRLYGTAYSGGGFGPGGIFRLNKDGSGYQTIYGFKTTGSDGQSPLAGLIEGVGGYLYGTTEFGGISNKGCIFRIAKAGTNYTRLRDLGAVAGGAVSSGGTLLQHSDGFLYGTTYSGGVSNLGTVFKLAPDGSSFITLLKSFGFSTSEGAEPRAGLVERTDGLLMGTTRIGGTNSLGTVFRIGTDGPASYQTVRHFSGLSGDGSRPRGPLLRGSGGVYYGTTFGGGNGDRGTVFRIIPP